MTATKRILVVGSLVDVTDLRWPAESERLEMIEAASVSKAAQLLAKQGFDIVMAAAVASDEVIDAVRRHDPSLPVVTFDPKGLVDELHRTEAKLATSEARFWDFFNYLPVGVGIIDQEGRWVQLNPRLQDLLGYNEEELIGHTSLEVIHPEDRKRAQREFEWMVAGHHKLVKHEARMLHCDGHTLWTDVTAMAIEEEEGAPRRFVGIVTDVSPMRDLEIQMHAMEKLRLVGQLAGGVAHDFNNLLTIINSYTDWALVSLGEEAPEAFALQKVLDAGRRGAALIDQLLAFSRRQIARPSRVDINSVFTDLRDMITRSMKPHINLEFQLDPEVSPVWIDRSQLEQILLNLIFNAKDALTDPGQLTVATRQTKLTKPYYGRAEKIPVDTYSVLEVRDTGHGIDPENLEHIFEPFFSTKEVGKGSGLGLASTWGLVKQAGGYLDVESVPGEGSTFTVYLPAATEREDRDIEGIPLGYEPIDPNATILLVEDDADVRDTLAQFLQRRGYHLLEANDGVSALEQSHQHEGPIDILLSEVLLPKMNGDELAAQLTQERPETYVVLMDGDSEDLADELPADWQLMYKPLDLDQLTRRLRGASRSPPPTDERPEHRP